MAMLSPEELLKRLRRALELREDDFIALKVYRETGDPFKVLVATVLSQNTTEANAFTALRSLERLVGLDPDSIHNAPLAEVERAIRPAGLWRQKARAIKRLAEMVVGGLDLESLLELGSEEVRRVLEAVPGIGRKTVDVLLALFKGGVIPVDTHVRRVARRLGLTPSSSYEGVKRDLESFFPSSARLEAHYYLIILGRTICKAKRPLCGECPIGDACLFKASLPSKSVTEKKTE